MPIHFNKVNAIRFAPFTTAERDAIPVAAREGLVIRNSTTSQLELCLSNVWYGIARLQVDGTITPAQHGPFVDGDLHNEYARTQAPEDITTTWRPMSGGHVGPPPAMNPGIAGSVGLQVRVGTGAPVHSAHLGVPCWVWPDDDLYIDNDGSTGWTKISKDGHTHAVSGKVSKSIMFHSPNEDLAVEDWLSDQAVRVPASGKHGVWTPGTIYVRVGTAGTGTNTVLFRTSTTLTGARTTRATVNLGTNREASAAITWTPADGQYMWVAVSAVGATAPKNGVAQIDIEEAVY